MDIEFTCTRCDQSMVIDQAGAGMEVECPRCRQRLNVPDTARSPVSNASSPRVGTRISFRRGTMILSAVVVFATAAVGVGYWYAWSRPARDALLRAGEKYWSEGMQDRRACKVLGVSNDGLVVTMTWHRIYSSEGTPVIISESRVVLLTNHPRQTTLKADDLFSCVARRAGSLETKEASGGLRRLPRWVYVSEAAPE